MHRLLLLGAASVAALALSGPAAAWSWPADGEVIRAFTLGGDAYAAGQHRGIDVAGPDGSPVRAPASGTVSFAGSVPTHGRGVTILTSDGYAVTLVHLGSIGVAKGDTVSEGSPVGSMGSSGEPEHAVTTIHLGIRLASQAEGYVDPLGLLPPRAAGPAPATSSSAVASAPAPAPAPVAATPAAAPPPSAQPAPVPGPAQAAPPSATAGPGSEPAAASTPAASATQHPPTSVESSAATGSDAADVPPPSAAAPFEVSSASSAGTGETGLTSGTTQARSPAPRAVVGSAVAPAEASANALNARTAAETTSPATVPPRTLGAAAIRAPLEQRSGPGERLDGPRGPIVPRGADPGAANERPSSGSGERAPVGRDHVEGGPLAGTVADGVTPRAIPVAGPARKAERSGTATLVERSIRDGRPPGSVVAAAVALLLLLGARMATRVARRIGGDGAVLRDDADLLRQLDPAHRARLHDRGRGRLRAPSAAARP